MEIPRLSADELRDIVEETRKAQHRINNNLQAIARFLPRAVEQDVMPAADALELVDKLSADPEFIAMLKLRINQAVFAGQKKGTTS